MERELRFEGITNARDLGGLQNASGQRIRSGLLLRAAHLHSASDRDLAQLAERFHLGCVVDLRTAMERREKPDRLPAGTAQLCRPIFDEATAGITREDGKPAELIMPDMRVVYRHMVTKPSCLESLRVILQTILEQAARGNTVLWHCTAGKDRCGVVTALLLSELDVPREDIFEDYLLTNRVAVPEAEAVCARLLAKGHPAEAVQQVYEAFIAREEYLAGVFDALDKGFGGVPGFLREGLQLPETLLKSFREAVLEKDGSPSVR